MANKWMGIGRLTKDPDVRFTQEGTCVARYTVAIDRYKKDETDFIPCVAFGKQGEFAQKYLAKGKKVFVSGRIQTGSYVNKNGTRIYTTEIVVDGQEFVESKGRQEPQQETPQEIPPKSEGFMEIPDDAEGELPFI